MSAWRIPEAKEPVAPSPESKAQPKKPAAAKAAKDEKAETTQPPAAAGGISLPEVALAVDMQARLEAVFNAGAASGQRGGGLDPFQQALTTGLAAGMASADGAGSYTRGDVGLAAGLLDL